MTIELTGLARSTATGGNRPPSVQDLATRYRQVRDATERLCDPLEIEDYVVQSMPDASPVKWHLAHTSWFFETFVLKPSHNGRGVSPGEYAFLFNSYYNALGERIERGRRGLLTRPTVAEVFQFRTRVDEGVVSFLESADEETVRRLAPFVNLGINHEQQHQELLLTDLKHLFGSNPFRPAYRPRVPTPTAGVPPVRWVDYPGGLGTIGYEGDLFAFDNESPRHRTYNEPYRLANRLVTNGEYLGFVEDAGYDRPEFWLSDGWNARQSQGWTAPLYWRRNDEDTWRVRNGHVVSVEQAFMAASNASTKSEPPGESDTVRCARFGFTAPSRTAARRCVGNRSA